MHCTNFLELPIVSGLFGINKIRVLKPFYWPTLAGFLEGGHQGREELFSAGPFQSFLIFEGKLTR